MTEHRTPGVSGHDLPPREQATNAALRTIFCGGRIDLVERDREMVLAALRTYEGSLGMGMRSAIGGEPHSAPQPEDDMGFGGRSYPVGTYATIVADPPWPYEIRGPASSKEHRPNSHGAATSSVERYGAMSIEALCDLGRDLPKPNAHLYLWTTNSFLVEAHTIAHAWGFEPKTLLTWGKVKEDGSPSMKTGFYYRGATEPVLFAVRGSLRLMGLARPTLFLSPRLPHSVKPDWFYTLVEEQSPGPRIELFARRSREGWAAWGNQVEGESA